jgi:hypothetical protein
MSDAVDVALDGNHYLHYERSLKKWWEFNQKRGDKVSLWNLLHGLLRARTPEVGPGEDPLWEQTEKFNGFAEALKLPKIDEHPGSFEIGYDDWLTAQVTRDASVDLMGIDDTSYTVYETGDEVSHAVMFISFGRRIYDKKVMLENSASNLIGFLEGEKRHILAYPDPGTESEEDEEEEEEEE